MDDEIRRNIKKCDHYLAAINETLSKSEGQCVEGSHIRLGKAMSTMLCLRVGELSQASLLHLAHRDWVAAAVLTRSVVETVALMGALRDAATAVLRTSDSEEFEKSLEKIAFGSRLWGDSEKAVNVLTYVDKLAKRAGPVRQAYDLLSEYCHPNALGVLASYGEIERKEEGLSISFGSRNRGAQLARLASSILLRVCLAQCLEMGSEIAEKLREMEPRAR